MARKAEESKTEKVLDNGMVAEPSDLPTPATKEAKKGKGISGPSRKANAEPVVSLRVFLTACGVKLDQMAGFQSYAKRKNLTAMTMKSWREEYNNFQKLPVR